MQPILQAVIEFPDNNYKTVQVLGSWNDWTEPHPMKYENG